MLLKQRKGRVVMRRYGSEFNASRKVINFVHVDAY